MNISHPLDDVREYLDSFAVGVWRATHITVATAKRLAQNTATNISSARRTLVSALSLATTLVRAKVGQLTLGYQQTLILLICACLLLQPNAALATRGDATASPRLTKESSPLNSPGNTPSALTETRDSRGASRPVAAPEAQPSMQSYFESLGELISVTAAEPLPPPVDAAISRKVPRLENGRVGGNLRVYAGQSFSFDGGFTVTDETYVVGTPTVHVATNATYHGSVDAGGNPDPTGYSIDINGTSRLVGQLHIRSDALAFPADIPTSVPPPAGTRIVSINTASDLNNIGNWATLKELHVNKSGETINVPPGTYGAFSVNGNSRLNFIAGVYNFSDGFTFASNASIKVTGKTTINISSSANISNTSLLLGDNTLAGDVQLNCLGETLLITGNTSIRALVRVPNGTAQVTGASVVHGQVIADTLQILSNGNVDGDTASSGPAETTPPTVAITSPLNNSTTQSATITVSGTASDPGTNATGIASVTVNNTPANYNANNGTWTLANVPIAIGSNTITARATDYAGNQSTPQQITVNRPDTTAPTVEIKSPLNGSSTQDGSITVSGTAADVGANVSGLAEVKVNGVPASLNTLTGNWSLSSFALTVGSNNPITAIATDNAGNHSTPHTINVIRQPPSDTIAPTLTIDSPGDNSHTELATTTVTGSVADVGQYPSGVAQVTVNDVPATINGDCTWTRANVPLSEGPNPIVVIARDNAGNQTTKTRTVFRDNLSDTQLPTITITSPENGFISSEPTIIVSATASDDGPNATGVQRVVINNQEATYDSVTHRWTATVTLVEGPNAISAYAEDGATPPNRGPANGINVTLHTPDTKAPTVTITSPLTSFETTAATLNLAGTAIDDGLNFTGVQSVKVNGQSATFDAGTGQWSLNSFALDYGPNHIEVIATDGAAPPNHGYAAVDVTRLQVPAPSLTISYPQTAAVLAASSITVAGTVTSGAPPVTVTVNNASANVSGDQFARTVTLTEGANTITVEATDSFSHKTQSSISVIRDSSPPSVSFANVPATVQPGSTYQILVDAADNIGVADVEFRVNGQYVGAASATPYQFTLTIPLANAAGSTLVLSAIARDLTNTTAVATAQTQIGGPGGISGYAFDDATGYVLPAVNVQLNGDAPAATDTQGTFNLVSSDPTGFVRLSKAGYTPVDRLYSVSQGEGTALFDARLTPLDSHANLIGSSGGTATGDGGRVQLSFNAGTLGEQTDIRLTSLSPQGLANLLPYGWSPVPGAVVDVRSATTGAPALPSFQSSAHLAITQIAGLTSGTPLVLARYDEAAQRWLVQGTNLIATNNGDNGSLSADLTAACQYAFLVADSGSTAPPPPAVGQPLTAAQPADSAALDSAQATAVATPRTAVFSGSARSSISFLATSTGKLPSGVAIEASFGETYNLLGGRDAELVDRPAQDFVLYAYPAATSAEPNRLGAFFVAKPTRTDFAITEIFNANVHVDIRSGRQNRIGVLIDANGGGLRAGDGSQLTIPANSISGSQTVFFNNLSPQLANVSLPPGYEIIAAYDVELGGATLTNSATISVPGLTGDLSRIVVARVLTVGGQRSPKAVGRAVADASDNLISTTTAPTVPAGVVLPGITTSGRYVFIRVPQDFGYVKGLVTEASNGAALGMVKVSGNQTPFIDVTGADGQFVIVGAAGAGALGANQIGAASLTTDATSTVNASLAAQDAVANSNISVSAVPLQVATITPATGAQNMIATTPVTITFNKPVAASSITGSSLTLSTSSGNPVLGTITVLAGNRVAVFTPAATLAASTTYRVSVNHSVRDIYGHQLAADFQSTFSTAATVTINNRLRPEQITISYPDANGMSTVSIPAGSVPEGSSILIVNNTSGSTLSTVAGTSALSLQIQARVGDELSLTISQPDGTQYRVTQAAYRRADGFTSVGSNGGSITSDDGKVLLSVPTGAISGQADIKLTTRAESDITIPRVGEMDPAEVPFGAGVRISVGGTFTNDQELHLEVAAPAGVTEGQRVAFMKPAKITENNVERDMWEVLTSGKVEGGKFKTMSPPFLGITLGEVNGNLGIYDAYAFMPRNFRGVTGFVNERVNHGAPRPLGNVLVFISAVTAGQPRMVLARTAPNGRFGMLDFAVSSADNVQVDAVDSLGRTQTGMATPNLSLNPFENPGLNGLTTMFASIIFPSSEGLPETQPASLRMDGQMLDLTQGQVDTLQAFGRVAVGSHIQVSVNATPDVKTITGQLMVGGVTRNQLVWRNPNPGSGNYETDFTVGGEGGYSVGVTTFTTANLASTKSTSSFSFVALSNPNTRPSIPGPPFVLSVTPRDGAQQVDSGTRIHLEFSEPVKNLVPGETIYLAQQGSSTRVSGTILSGGIPVAADSPNISSIDFIPSSGLTGGKTYTVNVTNAVVDSDNDHLDQQPQDETSQPFTSSFSTFQGLVLTTEPPPDQSYRVVTAGDLAATVYYDPARAASYLNLYDVSDPQHPKVLSRTFVPHRAIGLAISEIAPNDHFAVQQPPSTIVAITTTATPDIYRPNNLWIYSVDSPESPERIGVASLSIPNSSSEFPANLTIQHKHAYIGNTGSGGLLVVDLEAAVQKFQSFGAAAATLQAVLPDRGFNYEVQRQKVKYTAGATAAAPIVAASVIDQKLADNPETEPVAYVVGNKPQLVTFRLRGDKFDGRLGFTDEDHNGFDDRIVTMTDLTPVGYPVDVKAVSKVKLGGIEKDLVLYLGPTRLWIFDVTNPEDPRYQSSPSFTDLGGPGDYARHIEVEDTLAYVLFSDRVVVIDFHDPRNPIISSTITGIGTNLRWLTVKEGFVYTLSGETGPGNGLNVSIGRAASLVLVHGFVENASQTCGNPVIIDRQDQHMAQPAEIAFQVFGHDTPQSSKVIIRKTTIVDDVPHDTILATVPVEFGPVTIPNVVVGSAKWLSPPTERIDRSSLYTAEVVLDQEGSNEFHSRREPVPFSFLIDQYQPTIGVTAGQATFAYLLGGDAAIDLRIDNRDVLTSAGETRQRNFGSNQERTSKTGVPGTLVFNPPLSAGTYPFTLRVTMSGNPAVSDEAHGFVTVDDNRNDARLPGSPVVDGVELATGNLGLSVTDVEIKNRGLSLSVVRSYNTSSRNGFNPFGYGWRHNYQVLLQHISGPDGLPGAFQLIGGEGSGQIFNENLIQTTGRAAAELPYQGTLIKNSEGFDYFTKGHIRYHFSQAMDAGDDAFFNFSYMGNLSYIEEPNGNRITLSYDTEGRMVRATDSSRRTLDYTYELAETPLVGSMDVVQNATSCQSKARLGIMRQRFLQAQVGKAWRITKITGPQGLEIEYDYHPTEGNDPNDGNLISVTRHRADAISQPAPQDLVWRYEYNPMPQANPLYDHLLKSITAPNSAVAAGHKTTYTYHLDQFGLPVASIQMPESVTNTFSYTFGSSGNQITQAVVTDGLQQSRTYQLDHGRAVKILEPRGAETVLAWNEKGEKTLEIDPEGRQTATHYDANGNPDSQTFTGGNQTLTVRTTFDPIFSKPVRVTDANQNTTTYSLDGHGNVTRTVLPNGRDMRMDYAANGDLLRMVDQHGFATTIQYDTYGNPAAITRQTDGQTTVVDHQTYDDRSRLLTSDGTLAPLVENTYDGLDRVVTQTVTDPTAIRETLTTVLTYLPEGQVETVMQSGGAQQFNKRNTYDGLNRLITVLETPNNAGPFTLHYGYDANSNLLTETDRRGVTTTRTYDELNFPRSEILSGPFGQTVAVMTAVNDRVGNPLRVTNVYGQESTYEYDGLHRLTKRHLPGSFIEETAYDANGNVTSQKDRNGRETTLSYDAVNRRVGMRDPAGRTTTWTYDDAANTTTIQSDPQGLTQTVKADALGRPLNRKIKFSGAEYVTTASYNGRTTTTTDPRGIISVSQLSAFGETGSLTVNGAAPAYQVERSYGPLGGLKRSVDPNGRVMTYALDGLNRATLVSHTGGFSESFSYDGEGNVISHTDVRGTLSQMSYDNLGRLLTTVVQDGTEQIPVTTIAYDDLGNKETRTDANGHPSEVMYDGLHRVNSVTNADHQTRTLTYDGMNLLAESDFKHATTAYVYDPVDRLTQITDRLGQVTNIVNSDSGGYTKSVTDRRGNVTIEVYDPLQRLVSATQGAQPLVSYEYDGNNNRQTKRDGVGNLTSYTYDSLNRVTAIHHPDNLQTEVFAYDAVGNVLSYNDGAGGSVVQVYDELNHRKTMTDGAGNITKFKYDGGGFLLEQTQPKGAAYKTTYLYNALGSLKRVTDAKGGIWKFDYDGAQNLTSVKDALDRTVLYDYDNLDRLRVVTQPQGLVTTYGYDQNSNRTSVTDPKGQLTGITYDALDRAQTVGYTQTTGKGPRNYTYDYDPEGNLTGIAESVLLEAPDPITRSYARTYDSRNRLTGATDPNNRTVHFDYDAANNLKSLTDAANKETSYLYDAHNRLKTVTLPGQTGTIAYTWAADGLLKRVAYPSGMQRDYDYDPADRLTSVTNHINATESQQFAYSYDANSNRATETRSQDGHNARSITYDYDLLDRLTNADYTTPGQRPANPPAGQTASYTEGAFLTGFDYDSVSNRTTSTARDRTTTITLATDSEGVTTESRQIADGQLTTTTSQFDDLNRLTQRSGNAAGALPITYAYDRNGNLTSTTQNNQVLAGYEYDARDQLRRVVNSASQEVAGYDYDCQRHRLAKTVGGVSLSYVYGGYQVVNEYGNNNQLVNRYDVGAGEVVRAELGGEGERYYFSDGQGSITSLAQLTQGVASLTARYEYEAWGNYLGSSGASYNSIGYTGQRFDSETGLMPLGNGERYYSAATGSFNQQDSFSGLLNVPPSLNRYAYAHDNPVSHTDPSGHIIPIILLIGAAAIALTAVTTGTIRAHSEHELEGVEQKWASNDPRRNWGSAFGDGTGATKVFNAWSGQDTYTGRDLSTGERAWQGTLGAVEVVGNATAVGGLVFKGGSLGINLARGSEEAYQSVAGVTRSLKNFRPLLEDARSVGRVLRNPIQSGKAAASTVSESYSSIGGVKGALKEAWTFTREEALPRLNPRNYRFEREGLDVYTKFNRTAGVIEEAAGVAAATDDGARAAQEYLGPYYDELKSLHASDPEFFPNPDTTVFRVVTGEEATAARDAFTSSGLRGHHRHPIAHGGPVFPEEGGLAYTGETSVFKSEAPDLDWSWHKNPTSGKNTWHAPNPESGILLPTPNPRHAAATKFWGKVQTWQSRQGLR
jgi:RHS repeat-associated protein